MVDFGWFLGFGVVNSVGVNFLEHVCRRRDGCSRGTVHREGTLSAMPEVAALLSSCSDLFPGASPWEPVNLKAGV